MFLNNTKEEILTYLQKTYEISIEAGRIALKQLQELILNKKSFRLKLL